jgi:hypothetical protein
LTWFADQSVCDYFPFQGTIPLRVIAWLDAEHDYPRGKTRREVWVKLKDLLKDPWQPLITCGFHPCNLCMFESEAKGERNLFVPGDGFLYVCPELIVHYINAHGYAPPEDFCEAVLRCPDTQSMQYKRLFLANGGRSLMKGLSQ